MTTIATVNLYNSGSDYAVNAFGLVQGLSSSVSFDTTGSFTIPANSSIPITAEYDGTPVDQTVALYPRNLFVASSIGNARFYAVPNFVVVQPPLAPPAPTPSPPAPQPVFYTLSVNGGPNILSTVGSGLYSAGTVVSVDMAPAAGYQFVQWSGDIQFLQATRTVKSNTIIMPTQNIVITPEVQLVPPTTTTTTTPEPTTTTPPPVVFFESRGTTAFIDANNELIYKDDIWNQLINAVNSSSLPGNVKQDALAVIDYLSFEANNFNNLNTFVNYEFNSASGVVSVFFEPEIDPTFQYIINAEISASG
jgi:hypothetical protein